MLYGKIWKYFGFMIIAIIIIFIFLKNLCKKNKSKKYHSQIDDTSPNQKKGIDIIIFL